jgi:hypothetical protein
MGEERRRKRNEKKKYMMGSRKEETRLGIRIGLWDRIGFLGEKWLIYEGNTKIRCIESKAPVH